MEEQQEKKRVTRQIRVYEETARLIEEISRRVPGANKPTFAGIVEQWARTVHPDFYTVISTSMKAIEDVVEEINLDIYAAIAPKDTGDAGQGD